MDLIPVAHIDNLTSEKLSKNVTSCENITLSDGSRCFHMKVKTDHTSTILVRGTSHLVMDEAERSIHDALCVLRCIVKNRRIVAGGGAIEIEIWRKLEEYSQTLRDVRSLVV